MKKNHSIIYLLVVALVLPLIYSCLYAPIGFEDTDTGFMIAFGYRIANGEIPYKDFFYVRPPLSLYVSGILIELFPHDGQILYIRQFFYFYFSLIVLITILGIRLTGVGFSKKQEACIFVLAYVVSIHNFPPMMWHTIDGLFWCSVTLFYCAKIWRREDSKSYYNLFVGFASTLSALSKQSYYFLPLTLILLCVLYNKNNINYKANFKFSFLLSGIITPILFLTYWLYRNKNFDEFLIQIKGAGVLDFIKAGFLVYPYSILNSVPTIVAVGLSFLCIFYYHKRDRHSFLSSSFNSVIAIWVSLFLGYYFYNLFYYKELINPIFALRFDIVSFLCVFVYVFISLVNSYKRDCSSNKERLIFYEISMLGLLIAWMSSISWGYMTPILYFSPVLIVLCDVLNRKLISLSKVSIYLLILFLVCTSSTNLKPYRDETYDKISMDFGGISEKASGLYSTSQTFEKYKELKDIMLQFGCERTAVLPSQPLAHYLFGCNNPLRADWEMDVEIAYSVDSEFQRLKNNTDYVVVLNDKSYAFDGHAKFKSTITSMVEAQLPVVLKTKYYVVYKND